MTHPQHRSIGDSSLIDLLDRLVETGVVATGDVLLGLADVDLIRVNLQLVLGAVDTLMADDDALPTVQLAASNAGPAAAATYADTAPVAAQPKRAAQPRPAGQRTVTPAPSPAPALQPADRSDLGIGGLLVAVIEIVHRLLERQAIHRMERGSLTSDQIERLGQALQALDQRVNQLIEMFTTHSAPALPVTVTGAH